MAKTKAPEETTETTTTIAPATTSLPTGNSFETTGISLGLDNNYITIDITMSNPSDPLATRIMRAFYPKKSATFQFTFKASIDSKTGKETFGPDAVLLINNQTTTRVNIPVSLVDAGRVTEGKNALTLTSLTTFLTTNTAT